MKQLIQIEDSKIKKPYWWYSWGSGVFVGVAETIVSSLLWCSLGIAQCLSNLLYHVTDDCTRPKHKEATALRHDSASDSSHLRSSEN